MVIAFSAGWRQEIRGRGINVMASCCVSQPSQQGPSLVARPLPLLITLPAGQAQWLGAATGHHCKRGAGDTGGSRASCLDARHPAPLG